MRPYLREIAQTAVVPLIERRLRVADVLAYPCFADSRVVAGADGLERPLKHVNVMQVPTAAFARADELILAATSAFDDPTMAPNALITALHERGVAALAAHGPTLGKLGRGALATANALRLTVIELPPRARLSTVLTDVLETFIQSQAASLELAAAARDELADAVLTGGGPQRLVSTIADLTRGDAAVIGVDGRAVAISAPHIRADAERAARAWLEAAWSTPAETADGWVLWPIVAAGSALGCLAAALPDRREPVAFAAIQAGARTAAFEILHASEEAAAVRGLLEQFVRDLLRGTLDPGAARQRAAAVGLANDRRYRVVLAAPADGDADALAGRLLLGEGVTLAMALDGACLALAEGDATGPALGRELTGREPGVRVGLSLPHVGVSELPGAHDEARDALACARLFDGTTAVRTFDPLSPLRLLSRVPPAEMRAFERRVLAPLDALDAARREPLLATLEHLLAANLNVAEAARRGGWHYNTVRYRSARLAELLGPFAEDGCRLDALVLALLLRRELGLTSPPAC